MIVGQNSVDQPVKSNVRTYDNISKISAGQGDDYTSGCLLDYYYFKEQFNITATDLSRKRSV